MKLSAKEKRIYALAQKWAEKVTAEEWEHWARWVLYGGFEIGPDVVPKRVAMAIEMAYKAGLHIGIDKGMRIKRPA